MKDDNQSTDPEEQTIQLFITRLTQLGVGMLLLSALLLITAVLLSNKIVTKNDPDWTGALILMGARTCGIASFLCGAGLVLLEQWTRGTLLFILSIALPVLSFVFLETI